MSTLLNSLSAPSKTAYQSYLFEHGIERMTVLIPLKHVPEFEAEFAKISKNKAEVLKLIEQVGGKLKV